MMNKRTILTIATLSLIACDGGERKSIEEQIGPASKKTSELKTAAEPAMSPEELAEARRKAGFIDPAEQAAKVAAEMEKGEREYVKTRLKEFRAYHARFVVLVDELAKEAPKVAAAKDPQKAFDKWMGKFAEKAKEPGKTQRTLSEENVRGGKTNEMLINLVRVWDDLRAELGPDSASQPRFEEVVTQLRDDLGKLAAALDDIEKDEDLVVNKFYKPTDEEKGKKK